MQPAGQRLEPGDVPGGQLDDRLEVRHDLAALDAAAQLGRRAQRQHGGLVGARSEGLHAVASSGLGAVHRGVRVAQQVGRRHAVPVVDRDADAGGHEQLRALDHDGIAQGRPQLLGHAHGVVGAARHARQDDDELVATEAGEDGLVTQGGPQAVGHRRQQRVADAVPEAVVDGLEVVEVDEQQGHVPRCCLLQQRIDAGDQLGAVGQAGEVVVGRRPLQPFRCPALLRDVLDVRDGERDTLVLGDRHPRAGPDELTVAAQVALVEQIGVGDAQLEAGAMGGGGPQVVGVRDLADRAADEVGHRPGQHVGQRAVGVDDRRVVEPHECHAGRRRVEGLLEAAPGLLQCPHPLLPLGDVAQADDHCSAGLAWEVDVGLDDRRRRSLRLQQPQREGRHGVTAPTSGQPLGELVAVLHQLVEPETDERAAARQLGGLGVGAADDAVVVDRHDAFRQVVQEQPQLGLGVDQPVDGAVEVTGDPPRLEPRDDDRGDGEQGGDDRRGDHARRAVGIEADDERHQPDEQQSGHDDRDDPAPGGRPPPDGDTVSDIVTHEATLRDGGDRPAASPMRVLNVEHPHVQHSDVLQHSDGGTR